MDTNTNITQKISNIVANQARVCEERHRAIETEARRLARMIEKQAEELDALRIEMATMKTVQAVAGIRFGIAAAIGAAVPTIALGIIFLLAK